MEKLWNNAKFITTEFEPYFDCKCNVWGRNSDSHAQHLDLNPWKGLPVFVRNFKIGKPENAKIIFTALGCIDMYINGKRVGNDELKPGFITFDKRTLYHEYDITGLLQDGDNRVLAVLAGGWYSGRIAGDIYDGKQPSFMACITNNGECAVATDNTWKASVCGQIRTADIWDGEFRDGRLDDYSVMSTVDFDVSEWENAEFDDSFNGEITPFVGPTVKVRDALSLKAKKITVYNGINYNGTYFGKINVVGNPEKLPVSLKKGEKLIIDLEQEMVGWAKITVKGTEGTTVKMRYAEFLNDSGDKDRGNDGPKGSLYTINYRSALSKAYYILNGKGKETYRPTFTFFGYRFVEISADEDIELVDFISEVVGSDNRETGKIETSDELVNKLISNTLWGQRSNYLSVPTDCPQRDERLGWTGDAQAFSVTAAYNADVRGFFHKWMQDMRDSQTDDGAFTDVAPRVSCCHSVNACAWTDAGIIIPYNIYKMFADKALLEEHYDAMEKYIAQLISKYGMSGAIPRYGDWLAYDWCANEFISSAYFVHDLDMMAEISEAVGKADRAELYKATRIDAQKYFEDKFMLDGKLKGTSQCEKVISLAFNLISGDYALKVADELVEQIKENGNRLSTGFLGTYNLCPTLSKFGKDNMAYTLLMQRNEPSWLYSIDQGATTIWERWNSYKKSTGFGDVGMNSFNHYAYGSIVEWMYRFMAGIEPSEPGFGSILLQPRVDTRTEEELPDGQQRMLWVKAEYDSVNGLIKSAWSNEDGFVYECTVPDGIFATLKLPEFTDNVIINGVKHSFDEFESDGNCAVIKLSSGEYKMEEV